MRHIKGHVIGAIKVTINICAAVLVIAQAAGPIAPLKHESKSRSGNDKLQPSLDLAKKPSSFRLAANDRVTLVPCKASAVSNRTTTAMICPSTTVNPGAVNKMVKAGFRPVHSNRTFLSD